MALAPYETSLKKGPWTPEEDHKLVDCIQNHGLGNWKELPKLAGLNRCGKSCRLRWTNYLRPDIKRGAFSDEEQQLIIDLHAKLRNKWSAIAGYLPGRTDNEIKNFWNTHLKKKLLLNGIDPITHMPSTQFFECNNLRNPTWENVARLQTDAARLAKIVLLGNILQLLNAGTSAHLPKEAFTHSSESAHLTSSFQLEDFDTIPQPAFQNMIDTNSFKEVNRNEFRGLPTGYANYTVPDLVSASPVSFSTDQTKNDIISPAD